MAEDRKKMLEALVAKRKAEAEGGGRPAHKPKPSSLLSKPASVKKSSPLLHNPKPSPLVKLQKQQHHKKDSPPKKKKRVEKYDSEDDDQDDEESDEDSDSEDEPVKKKVPVPSSKGGSAVKASSLKPTSLKSKPDAKGKVVVKEKEKDSGKGKRKTEDSTDDDDNEDGGSGEEDVEADSGDEGLDKTNILPGRTRGRGSQPMHYDFTNMSGDDDDSD